MPIWNSVIIQLGTKRMQAQTQKNWLSKPRNRAGTTLVEFAVVVPLFFLFILAAFEFGRLNIIRHTADSAAYEAARYAMVPGAIASEAIAKADAMLSIVGTRGATVTVNPAVLGPDVDEILVTISVPMDQNGFIAPHFTRGQIIRAQSRLKTERTQQ